MGFELIYADEDFREIKTVDFFEQFDSSIGDYKSDNDWMLELEEGEWIKNPINPGDYVYIENTEWGGPAERVRHSSDDSKVRVYGTNWRGLLKRRGVYPGKDQTHYTIEPCEANKLMAQFLGGWRRSLFSVSDENSGIICSGSIRYKPFDETMATLIGENAGLHLVFSHGQVDLSVRKTDDLSKVIELSDEYDASVISQKRRGEYNHIIALGRGEMADRDIVEMWMLDDGTVTENANLDIPDEHELSTYIYDYSAVETLGELRAAAKKKLLEFSPTGSMEITLSSDDTALELMDRVAVRDCVTGLESMLRVEEKRLHIDSNGKRITHILK